MTSFFIRLLTIFIYLFRLKESNRKRTGRFLEKPKVKDYGRNVLFRWKKPKKISGEAPDTFGHLVYIILSRKRHQQTGWKIFRQVRILLMLVMSFLPLLEFKILLQEM